MAVLQAPANTDDAAKLVALSSFGIVFPEFIANVIPAPDLGYASEGGDDTAVGYAS